MPPPWRRKLNRKYPFTKRQKNIGLVNSQHCLFGSGQEWEREKKMTVRRKKSFHVFFQEVISFVGSWFVENWAIRRWKKIVFFPRLTCQTSWVYNWRLFPERIADDSLTDWLVIFPHAKLAGTVVGSRHTHTYIALFVSNRRQHEINQLCLTTYVILPEHTLLLLNARTLAYVWSTQAAISKIILLYFCVYVSICP